MEPINLSSKTMRKIWKEAGISSRKRRKKYVTKNNLRAVKKRYALFEKSCEDTKDLKDIPEYWEQMISLKLPRVQYTYREVGNPDLSFTKKPGFFVNDKYLAELGFFRN